MSFFGLDPPHVLKRARAASRPARAPSLTQSILLGTVGFGLVSVGVFAGAAQAWEWLQRTLGETGAYAVCSLLLIGVTGLVLQPLVIGPGAFWRFYGLFGLAGFIYAGIWVGSYYSLRSRSGEWLGSLLGPAMLGMTLANGFSAPAAVLKIVPVLFLTHATGYFAGDWLFRWFSSPLAPMLWGAAYGLGFGSGLGYTLYTCQEPIRSLLTRANDTGHG